MFWDQEREQQLRDLHNQGLSFSMIAARIGGGCTRNAAIGKATRMGLPPRDPGGCTPRPKKIRVPRAPKAPQPPKRAMVGEASSPSLPPLSIPPGERIPLMKLNGNTCRFPLGHVGEPDFGFCGRETWREAESPYCQEHHGSCRVRR